MKNYSSLVYTFICFICIIICMNLNYTERAIETMGNTKNIEKFANYNLEMNVLDVNMKSLDQLTSDIDTNSHILQVESEKGARLTKYLYIMKFITIICICLLILMICVYIIDFNNMKIKNTTIKMRTKVRNSIGRLKGRFRNKLM